MVTRNTRQKALILEVLEQDQTHPTMQELYEKVLVMDPCIGQATVYRNINRLVEEKKVRRISIANDLFRYDANMHLHHHLLCQRCGKIIDLYDDDCLELRKKFEKVYHVQVFEVMLTFVGICSDCLLHKERR